jgi:hypothetical protein
MTEREPTLNPEFKAFKDGVYDAIIHGRKAPVCNDHYYKRGYDFGMTIHSDMEEEE